MEPYSKTEEFRRLEKLAELEKRIIGRIERAKDSDGEIFGLSSIDNSRRDLVPASIKRIVVIRASSPIPIHALNDGIDDGIDSLASHINRHRIMMTPGEALYTAIGRKDPSIFDEIKNITIGEILGLIQNKAAVASTCAPVHMQLDDFDVPPYVKVMSDMRSMLPDVLYKQASQPLSSPVESFSFQLSNGVEFNKPKKFVEKHSSNIQKLIDDGAIIRVVQILSSGREKTLYDKTASSGDDDILYVEFLKALHQLS